MNGTEKQIAMGSEIKAKWLKFAKNLVEKSESLIAQHGSALDPGDLASMLTLDAGTVSSAYQLGLKEDRPQSSEQLLGQLKFFVKWVDKQQSAKWWIENNFTGSYLVTQFVEAVILPKVQAKDAK